MELKKVYVPDTYNYIGVFFTLGCNLSCSYCINHLTGKAKGRNHLTASDWIAALNRIQLSNQKIPLTIQGGEPTILPHFYEIINGLDERLELDLLTNIQFNVEEFSEKISTKKFKRDAPYASIRVSFHPETMDLNETIKKVNYLRQRDYSIGLFSVIDPRYQKTLKQLDVECENLGIDFRYKELLGVMDGHLYGSFKYQDAVAAKELKSCDCRTTELLIGPDGNVHRCHHDLYNRILPVGNMLDDDYKIQDEFRHCRFYGNCNPCDVKIKNNRFQKFGHTSVEIKNIRNS